MTTFSETIAHWARIVFRPQANGSRAQDRQEMHNAARNAHEANRALRENGALRRVLSAAMTHPQDRKADDDA